MHTGVITDGLDVARIEARPYAEFMAGLAHDYRIEPLEATTAPAR